MLYYVYFSDRQTRMHAQIAISSVFIKLTEISEQFPTLASVYVENHVFLLQTMNVRDKALY